MKQKSVYCLTMTIALCLSLLRPAFAVDFSADMTQKGPSMSNTSKYYQKGSKMRIETMSEGGLVATIINTDAKKMLQLMPASKMYMEMPLGGEFASWAADTKTQQEYYDMKLVGTETVNGQLCDKYIMTPKKKGLETTTTWISKKLGYPVKTVSKDYSMELTNIKEGGLADSLFTVPAGYKRMSMEMPEMPSGYRAE